jgi:hypothetical protein
MNLVGCRSILVLLLLETFTYTFYILTLIKFQSITARKKNNKKYAVAIKVL